MTQIAVNELCFLGHVISRDGIKADPKMFMLSQIYLSQLTKPSCKSSLECLIA